MKKIKIHYTFLILFILSIFLGLFKEFVCIILVLTIHEIGHLFFLKIFKYDVSLITIYPFGGVIKYKEKNDYNYRIILITLGGVIFNVLSFILFNVIGLKLLSNLSLFFFLINLIPILPLDGGRVNVFLMSYLFPYRISKIIGYILSIVISLFIIFFLIFNYDGIYLYMLLFVFIRMNITNILGIGREYNKFILLKYLNPNKDLKIKKTKFWTKRPLLSLFYGKTTLFDFETFTVCEDDLLESYYKNKKRLLN